MGILRAFGSSLKGVAGEQWKEAFFCDSLDGETLLCRGRKRVGERSANTRADDGVITDGSILSVADGQCVLVVSQGKVIDCCQEPGEHRFTDPNHPGGVKGFAGDVWNRVGFGGDVQPIRHRIYYVNTKECSGVRFDAPAPFPLAVRDGGVGADLDLAVQAGGVFSYRVKDPAALYRQVVGNIESAYQRTALNGMLKMLVLTVLPEALAALTETGVRPNALPFHAAALREATVARLREPFLRYGLELVSLAFDTLVVTDLKTLSGMQHAAVNRDPDMAAATVADAVGELARHPNP